MTSYKELYVNECLVMFLEFYLSLKYNVILLNKEKQSTHAKLHQLTRDNNLLDERGFHSAYICFVH